MRSLCLLFILLIIGSLGYLWINYKDDLHQYQTIKTEHELLSQKYETLKLHTNELELENQKLKAQLQQKEENIRGMFE